jgi:glutathione peroxidase
MPLQDFTATLANGTPRHLADWHGQVLLVVNVASQCGFTPQYRGLQALQAEFGPRGFTVLAFPCNQFGRQEPGTDTEIADFCDSRFGVTFPVFAKVAVNGAGTHPLYAWLKQQKPGLFGSAIRWNFTKFLLDRAGQVRGRFAPMTKPEALARKVAALL